MAVGRRVVDRLDRQRSYTDEARSPRAQPLRLGVLLDRKSRHVYGRVPGVRRRHAAVGVGAVQERPGTGPVTTQRSCQHGRAARPLRRSRRCGSSRGACACFQERRCWAGAAKCSAGQPDSDPPASHVVEQCRGTPNWFIDGPFCEAGRTEAVSCASQMRVSPPSLDTAREGVGEGGACRPSDTSGTPAGVRCVQSSRSRRDHELLRRRLRARVPRGPTAGAAPFVPRPSFARAAPCAVGNYFAYLSAPRR
jgi:hypothetical protein